MFKAVINPLSGKIEYRFIKDSEKKLSKNKKRKAERYGNAKPKAKRKAKKGITGWQYATQLTHRARFGCNPETKVMYNFS